ncbi:hypothetical protein [Nostoc sp.]
MRLEKQSQPARTNFNLTRVIKKCYQAIKAIAHPTKTIDRNAEMAGMVFN